MEHVISCLLHRVGDNVPLVLLVDTVATVGSLSFVGKVNFAMLSPISLFTV